MPKKTWPFIAILPVFIVAFLGCARIHKQPFFDKWDQKCLNLNYYLLEEKKALKGECVIAYGDYVAALGEIVSFAANTTFEFSGTSVKDRRINPGNIIYKTRKKIIQSMVYSAPYKKKDPLVYYMDIGDVFITTESFNSKNNYLLISEEGAIYSDLMYCSCGNDLFQPVSDSACHVVKTDLARYLGKRLFEKKTDTVLLYRDDDNPVIGFELVYHGRTGNDITLLYKEYMYEEETHRFQASPGRKMIYSLDESDTINYKSYKINVLDATTEDITYIVEEDKIDRSLYDHVKITKGFKIPVLTKHRTLF